MKVTFVGAGPGDPQLLTVRADQLLRNAQCCIYAGSLVSPEIVDLLPPTAEKHDSARMTLDEVISVVRTASARGDDVVRSGGYVRGFLGQAEDYGDMELIGLSSPDGVYGGSSRGWNTEETFNHFLDQMIEELEAAMPVDGVYLALHGAMAVRGVPRPEAEIARRFREVVGPDVPIAGSFDLHGNEDAEFLRSAATRSFATRTAG